MPSIQDKIQSIRSNVGVQYKRPDPDLLFSYQKDLGERALEYLHGRGLSDDTIKHFGLGYSKDRDAIAIPIRKKELLVNIKYRYIDPAGKARYGSEHGVESWLFNDVGIDAARDKGGVLIVEGEFDAMMCWQGGIKNVISPAAGANSFGLWLELVDKIPRVYIAYDNDDPGEKACLEMAERIGIDKSFRVKYPDGIKDANEFFLKHDSTLFREQIKKAIPFYKYKFKGVADIIESMRRTKEEKLQTEFIPGVELKKGFLIISSGKSNVGKTAFVLNIADDLVKQGVSTLILPFERGIESVGQRFLNVHLNKREEDFAVMKNDEWEPVLERVINMPLYFSLPKINEFVELVKQARRVLDTRVVIVDHLDYLIRNVRGNKEEAIANCLQEYKRIAEEIGITLIIVTHIRKIEDKGFAARSKRPGIEDLKGSSSLYQDPEVVVMLSETEDECVLVDVVKNKGEMRQKVFKFMRPTGRFESKWQEVSKVETKEDKESWELWNSLPENK